MIAIIVDSNILRDSPYLSRPEWASLAGKKAEWEVSLLIPDVVLMETTKVVPREWTKQRDTLRSAKVGAFDLQQELEALVQGVQEHIEGYEDRLRSRLSDLGAEIVSCPEVPHLEIAFRASRGMAPYHQGDKDGYRDTLIWLTVLNEAAANPQREVWFVSNNTTDFGDPAVKRTEDSNAGAPQLSRHFHPDLEEDLKNRGLTGRVRYSTSLRSLEQHIASLHGPISAEDLSALTAQLDFDALQKLLNDETSYFISPEDAALTPGTTANAVINSFVADRADWAFSDASGRGQDRWTVNFLVDAEAQIYTLPADPSRPSTMVNKTLRVSGTATFTKQGDPEEVQIAKVEALPDDPNRGLWAVLTATGFGKLDIAGSLSPGLFAFTQAIREAQGISVPPETLMAAQQVLNAAAQNFSVPAASLESINQALKAAQGFSVPAASLESINQALKAAQGFSVPAASLESINHALKAAQHKGPDEKSTDDVSLNDSAKPDEDGREEGGNASAT